MKKPKKVVTMIISGCHDHCPHYREMNVGLTGCNLKQKIISLDYDYYPDWCPLEDYNETN